MSDLRNLIEKLGFTQVRTVLNSGNIVFQASRPNADKIAAVIKTGIKKQFGFAVPVIVITEQELNVIIKENTLLSIARDPSKLLVAFVAKTAALAKIKPLLTESWAPDALAIGSKAAYLWCANGIIQSKLAQTFARATAEAGTARNWATMLKLQTAVGTNPNA